MSDFDPRPPSPRLRTRRQFLRHAAAFALGTSLFRLEANTKTCIRSRAAIIGHTGRGNYGHGLDSVFAGRPEVEIVAIADPDAAGRARAVQRASARRGYADYRVMLEREKPDLVCVASRWTDERFAMAQASLASGAHLFVEKPFTQTLVEADALLALAKQRGLKIAVAHQMRSAPNIVHLKQRMDEGLLGDVLEIRAHGKQDHRAGGEDLIVLGTHLFDLMRLFAGDPLWCSARVLCGDREVTRADVCQATEGIGLVLGDTIFAQFAFPRGVNATFQSRAANRDTAGPWGLELIGTKGRARIQADIWPEVRVRKTPKEKPAQLDEGWQPLEDDPVLKLRPEDKTVAKANARLVDDWLAAMVQDREPVCSGLNGMKAVEMALAVFEAGLQQVRIGFPLARRTHPLESSPG